MYLCIEYIYFKGEAGVWKVEVGGGPAGDTTGFLATLPEALGGLWVECLGLREMRLGGHEQGQSQLNGCVSLRQQLGDLQDVEPGKSGEQFPVFYVPRFSGALLLVGEGLA